MTKVSPGVVKRIVFISTYPPRHCGIATFTQDLLKNIRLLQPELELEVYAMNRTKLDSHAYPDEVSHLIDQDNTESYRQAAASINKNAKETLVVVQHEYGIHGGRQGEYLLELLRNLECPLITTLHTVLANPDKQMRQVTSEIIDLSAKIVLLTQTSLELIDKLYPGAKNKLTHIPHGVHPSIYRPPQEIKPRLKLDNRKVLLTFGLLGRNKGIEYVIESLPKIVKQFPSVIYLVLGRTHPDLLRLEGESYRNMLEAKVKELALQDHVQFVNNYIPLDKLLQYLQATDIYIASSLDPNQVVSGTLSYALGAGCAVVSTEFSQAKEVVNGKTGRVVPIKDSKAMSRAVIELLTDSKELGSMKRANYYSTRSMLWTNVADNYLRLLAGISASLCLVPPLKLNHLEAMSSKYGIAQFASGSKAALRHGYTLDDNSRAMQLMDEAQQTKPDLKTKARHLNKKYLRGISICLSQKPIVNYLSRDGLATGQNASEDLNDSLGRAYQALQANLRFGPPELISETKNALAFLPAAPKGQALRPTAFYLIGACLALEAGDKSFAKTVQKLAARLVKAYEKNRTANWQWFEPAMTYANGSLCAGLLYAAKLTGSGVYQSVGLESLDFLINTCFMGEIYVPIGQSGWYRHKGPRTLFDQQPEDVLAALQALLYAYDLTADNKYRALAHKAFSWFLGNNLTGVRMYDDISGGCHDGLTPVGPNSDEGAESSVAYLRARILIDPFK